MAVVMLSASEETCPRIGVCQSSDPTSDADLEGTDKNAAWAGIAVVIVLVVVSVAVWLAIRRRRRARGGHNSVDTGPRLSLPRRMALFWRRPTTHSLSEHESKPPRPSSSASNLKRMTTIEITSPPPAKLPERSDAPGQYPMLPLRNTDATVRVFTNGHLLIFICS